MKLLAVLFLACVTACAPEYNTTHDEPVAGRAGLLSEPLNGDVVATRKTKAFVSCASNTVVCSTQRALVKQKTGTSWTWSSPCSSDTWLGTAPGGRSVEVYRWRSTADEDKRFAYPSQSSSFALICGCGNLHELGCDYYYP